ncbi:hypothetical protein KOI40_08425 [Aestuariicella sp. G3-2]|uniref:hypothetical protein n=1 Tax=Pseudomaricurvus albidus TaxID=2842452 RepID=UPI001C0B2A23|nr:hypothetical protein [Aestuariicella albida]MBU3069844.1 hypothetical protein [Aestuariicella albida]
MSNVDAYVTKADGKQVRVQFINQTFDSRLKSLGFSFDSSLSMYIKNTSDQSDKANTFALLRDSGVGFSDGKEWCPSELFEYFREQKLITGKFKRISWSNPKSFTIKEI